MIDFVALVLCSYPREDDQNTKVAVGEGCICIKRISQ